MARPGATIAVRRGRITTEALETAKVATVVIQVPGAIGATRPLKYGAGTVLVFRATIGVISYWAVGTSRTAYAVWRHGLSAVFFRCEADPTGPEREAGGRV
jgi:hypothetical protein